MKSRETSVRVETGPSTFSYGMQLDRPFTSGTAPVARGPVRLIIDMPGKSPLHVVVALITSVMMTVTLTLAIAGLAWVGGHTLSPAAAFLALPTAVFGFLVVIWFSAATAKREIFTLDSRFLTLERGDLLTAAPRELVDTVELIELRGGLLRRRHSAQRHFWLRFGSGEQTVLASGIYLSADSARMLEETIRDFMDEHPPEPGFRPPVGGSQSWPMSVHQS